jgi:hypothetical protein
MAGEFSGGCSVFLLYDTISQWQMLPIERGADGKAEIHYTRIWAKWKQWVEMGSISAIFYQSVRLLKEHGHLDLSLLHGDGSNTVSKKGGDKNGYSGHKHQKGNKCISIQDNAGNILAPMIIAAVNQSDMVLLVDALNDLKTTFKLCNLSVPPDTVLNLDPGFDSRKNRKAIWNSGLKPNIKENKRNRKNTKRGRKRFFDPTRYKQRYKCERTYAWQDKL